MLVTPRAYRCATVLAGPAIDLWIRRRCRAGKEDAARLGERFGHAGRARPVGQLVWMHGASVGECLSLLPLVARLEQEPAPPFILLTSGTVTSARLLQSRLSGQAFHQFVPVDRPGAVRRFLDHWRPDLAIWVESELWPNLVLETAARRVPMLLLNARMSARSAASWRRMPRLIAPLLGAFAAIHAQSEADAERLRSLGARGVDAAGNLKYDAPPLAADEVPVAAMRRAIGARPCWLAASTHEGEDAIIAAADETLRPALADLLTIVVPRHPKRGEAIARLFAGRGLRTARRAADEPISDAVDVYVGDTLGELGLFYRLAPVVLVGGSLQPFGGHNPLEAVRLNAAVLTGRHHENFAEAYGALLAGGGGETVSDQASLAAAVHRLLADDSLRTGRIEAADRVARSLTGATAAALELVRRHLARNDMQHHESAGVLGA